MSKQKAVSLHRAAIRACQEAGRPPVIDRRMWEAYVSRAIEIGSRTQLKNFNFRLESLGLLKSLDKEGVELLESDYSQVIL